ncbi:YdeI/OmpD-associated family protein [Hymenobacter sp. DG25A]|uniref:YdeI/OmpD-associated family protein n=1 Tax=Hymenobacter sp. DG25A TaxID=1385663 RepID=UPI0006BDE55B|nr:YdeI/OmpD-associated family protein [Hymenobacter sp. DG25A]ALD20384.1 hypothetical protein AM218_02990 [Hymenobacter sp. DG25A]
MTPEHTFDAPLELDAETGGVFVLIPFSVEETYGVRGLLPVQATIDGFPYRGSLSPMGDGHHALLVQKQIRNAIGKSWSQSVHVTLSRDTEERTVNVPEELAMALDRAGLRQRFDALSFTHRKEFAQGIERAKKSETRARRVQDALDRIASGRKP